MRWFGVLVGLSLGVAVSAVGCDDDVTPSPTPTGAGGGLLEDAGSISGLALINPTCGVGDGGTVSQACVDCSTDHCTDDFVACFGSTWETTLEGGVCTSFGQCVMACDCGDHVCFNDCLAQLDAASGDPCRACIVDLVTCEQTYCDTECDTDPRTDGGQGGSGQGGKGQGASGSGQGGN